MRARPLTHFFAVGVFFGLLALTALADKAIASEASAPETALALLTEGNKRFVSGTPNRNGPTAQQWTELAKAQHPFAIILICADSRLSTEIIFDQGLGEL